MTNLVLAGCRTTPLGGYLGALGLLRAVTRLLDPAATGRWERRCFVLGSRFDTSDDLVDALLMRFEPEAIVSPWNAGSGFAGNGKSRHRRAGAAGRAGLHGPAAGPAARRGAGG